MARNPTTKSQVQAYRFVLRRMESALVRKDPVMLHEPMRTHLRAAAVGLIIGVLGVAAFFVVGLFAPDDDLGDSQIVVGKQSGAIFVVQQAEPRRLIPVLNLASARLLLASAAFSSGAVPSEAAEVKVVEDSSLADLPRAPMTGIEGAPTYLPGPERQVDPEWAVCDTTQPDETVPDAEAGSGITTTALVGVPQPGRQLGEDRALLARAVTGDDYLLFDGRRAQVNIADRAVSNAFGLADVVPRPVSTALLNAIPASDALVPPEILGAGDPAPFPGVAGQRIGDVFQVNPGGPERYYLLLPEGKQLVSRGVANLIRYDRSNDPEIPLVTPEDSANVPDVPRSSPNHIDLDDYPEQVPEIVPVTESRVACLTWAARDGEEPATAITISDEIELDEGMRPLDVQPSVAGREVADRVFLPPSKGALVRGVVPGQAPNQGAIFLVTDLGFRYGVPTIEVAQALGLGDTTQPAPEEILSLLPIGPPLKPQTALELFDPRLAAQQLEEQLGTG